MNPQQSSQDPFGTSSFAAPPTHNSFEAPPSHSSLGSAPPSHNSFGSGPTQTPFGAALPQVCLPLGVGLSCTMQRSSSPFLGSLT